MKFDFFNSVKAACGQPCTLDTYLGVLANPDLTALAKQIITCDDKEKKQQLKKHLPVITWQASFGGKARRNDNAIPSGLYMADFDDVADVKGLMNLALKRREELDIVYIGRSIGGKGVRVVAECRPEFKTIAECQEWLSRELGQPCDEACKDWARASYMVPDSYVFYMDQGLFGREPKVVYQTESRAFRKVRAEGELVCTMPNQRNVNEQSELIESRESRVVGPEGEVSNQLQTTYRGLKLNEIAMQWLESNGGVPVEGERNARLFKLATRMRYITDFNATVVAACIPHCGLSDAEVKALCASACQTQRAAEMPYDLQAVIKSMLRDDDAEEGAAEEAPAELTMPAALPPVFKQFYDAAPADFKQASVLCLLPILGTLGSRLRAKYLNHRLETPSFMVTLEAPQASGKSFIESMTERCLRQLKKKDDEGRLLERMYEEEDRQAKLGSTKAERQEHKQNKENRKVPLIRKMPATASITKLLIRMENAQGLHLFALAVEIDTVYKAFKRGFSNLSDLLRCAFDNSEYGQDYATDTSYSGNLNIFYNTLYSGTPKAIKRFYPDSEDGTLSRTLFVTLPDQFGKKMPVWRDMTPVEEALLDAHLTKLYEVSVVGDEVQPEHEMEMEFLNRKLDAWMEEQRKKSVETDDRVRNTFYRRCAEVAFRAGMLAWFLWDEKKSAQCMKKVADFSVWVAEMMLRQFVVRVQEDAQIGGVNIICRAAYNALPNQFSRQQLETTLREFGFVTQTRKVISSWKMQGCIACDKIYGSQVLSKCPNVQMSNR